jgi:nucleoid-associated protein YejK
MKTQLQIQEELQLNQELLKEHKKMVKDAPYPEYIHNRGIELEERVATLKWILDS